MPSSTKQNRRLGFEILESKLTLSGQGILFADSAFEADESVIGGTVFHDEDNDGQADWQEERIGQVVMALRGRDADGNAVERQQLTKEDGSFAFRNLDPGTYSLYQLQPEGFLDGRDANPNGRGLLSDDQIHDIEIGRAEQLTDFLFGELEKASIRGTAFVDVDRDGADDANDEAIEGLIITLNGIDDRGASVSRQTTTNEDGDYLINNLRPGVYTLEPSDSQRFHAGRLTLGNFSDQPHPTAENGQIGEDGFVNIRLGSGDEAHNYDFGEWDDTRVEGVLAKEFDEVITFRGSNGDDNFIFRAGHEEHTIILNGERLKIDASHNISFRFDGREGNDTVTVYGTDHREDVNFRGDSGKVAGTNYEVRVFRINNMSAIGNGGGDRAFFYGTRQRDSFEASSTEASMQSRSYSSEAHGFHRVYAYAEGRRDHACLIGSSGRDHFKATPDNARMYGESFYVAVHNFSEVTAAGNRNQLDDATIWDSVGDDHFILRANQAEFMDNDSAVFAVGFHQVTASSIHGGQDTVDLIGSRGTDYLEARPTQSFLASASFRNVASNFEQVNVYGRSGNNDSARLYGSFDVDHVELQVVDATLRSTNFGYAVHGFEQVEAIANHGRFDSVDLLDSKRDDLFSIDSDSASMNDGQGRIYTAIDFGTVNAISRRGNDSVILTDTSDDDLLRMAVGEARLESSLVDQHLMGFDNIEVLANSGFDTVEVHRRRNRDHIEEEGDTVEVSNRRGESSATGFDEVIVDP